MGQFDLIFGPVLLVTWLNAFLYTIICTSAIAYFGTFKKDNVYYKIIVILTLLLCTADVSSVFANVYLFTVSGWGDLSILAHENWTYPVIHSVSGFTGFIVQSYLIYRYVRLSKQYIIGAILECGAAVCLAGSLLAAVGFIRHPLVQERDKLKTAAIMWLGTSIAVDVGIALCLVVSLSKVKTNFKDTRSLIHRIMGRAISTGSITAIWSVVTIVTYFAWPSNNIVSFFSFSFGQLYGVTLLYSLNVRKTESNGESGPQMSSTDPGVRAQIVRGDTQLNTLNVTGGVNVHRVVHVDTAGDNHFAGNHLELEKPGNDYSSDTESVRDKSAV